MQKPSGYDEARESGSYVPPELGGHYAVIKQVTEKQSKTGKDMIVVLFDFADNDKQKDYFSQDFAANTNEDKKWPFAGMKYIMVLDYEDEKKTSRQFKTFCTCVEKSNNINISWGGSDWSKQFKNKKIGVVFGEEEQEYDGETRMRRLPRFFCSWDKVADSKVPETKYLNGKSPAAGPSIPGFTQVADDEIPF